MSVKIKKLSVCLGGKIDALNDVNLELPAGKIVGIIGPSGAGKTTLLRSIVGRLKTKDGSVTILGQPAGSATLRNNLSYMTQELSVYSDLTVYENIMYFATMLGQPKKQAKQTANSVLGSVDLLDKINVLVSNLSGGQKQRVSLAVALIGSPKIMVLDEPTVGLDPVLRNSLWDLFKKLSTSDVTLLVSSHSMGEATRCDYLVLIRNGKIIAHDTPANLLKQTQTLSIEQCFLKLVGGENNEPN